jgi:hypothetical protein
MESGKEFESEGQYLGILWRYRAIPLPKNRLGFLVEDIGQTVDAVKRREESAAKASDILDKVIDKMMGDTDTEQEHMSILQHIVLVTTTDIIMQNSFSFIDQRQTVEYDNNNHISSADIATLIKNLSTSETG